MNKKWILCVPALLLWLTALYGQSSDSLCFTQDERRIIAEKLIQGEDCAIQLQLSMTEISTLNQAISAKTSENTSLKGESLLKDQIIHMHMQDKANYQNTIKQWKRKYNSTLMVAGGVVLSIILISLR